MKLEKKRYFYYYYIYARHIGCILIILINIEESNTNAIDVYEYKSSNLEKWCTKHYEHFGAVYFSCENMAW